MKAGKIYATDSLCICIFFPYPLTSMTFKFVLQCHARANYPYHVPRKFLKHVNITASSKLVPPVGNRE